ncbi:MAG: HisA/HisF-related TIM barrel protein [Actinomycetota bacterium]|jgi:phosphoribosylformimino-5-aminoimidazole carboxamide ribotide isomerase|nr:HisA/HisF-related TIM barrel protein [Actinomycetota bacterium]
MELFPAIDLRDGAAVRLVQGDFSRESRFGDPVELAGRYVEGGARWIHVVDLDAARTGAPANRGIVLEIARSSGALVQAGGGVRSVSDVESLLAGGVARVVLGTAALRSPELVDDLAERFPGAVAVGLDHRSGGRLAAQGWSLSTEASLGEALTRFDDMAIAAFVVTAIERDGTLGGPDMEGMRACLERSSHDVVASGGVSSIEDIRALRELEGGGRRLAGVVVGRAIVEGTIGIEEALVACGA